MSIDIWRDKENVVYHTMEYYSVLKYQEIMPLVRCDWRVDLEYTLIS